MRKKIASLLVLSGIVFSLSACQFFNQSNEGGYSYRPIGSSNNGGSDVSTPPASDLEAKAASMTYGNYAKNNIYPISATPSKGKAKLLVIPVWFTDSANFIQEAKRSNVYEDIKTVYFGKNTDAGWRSVKTYYEEESHGALKLEGTVSEWYECNKSYQLYRRDDTHDNTASLVNEATKWYFDTSNPSDKRTDYDCDKDGYLDGVMLIYAAPALYGQDGGSSDSNLWAYCYWTQNSSAKNVVKPGVNAFFWASYDFMYDKDHARTRTGKNYASGDNSNNVSVDAHTYIHEMGHMFGLEDYYDYSKYGYLPAGGFNMQDHNVGSHDPFSVFALGWGKAYIPTTSANINLKPFTTSGEMIILSPNWNEYNSPFDEYLILEYYTADGLNYFDANHAYMSGIKQYPTGSLDAGIRLWHVDARLLYTNSNSFSAAKVTTNPSISGQKVHGMFTNTYNDGQIDMDYLSRLASRDPAEDRYSNYNLLELIRNSTVAQTKTKDKMTSANLFKEGDSFVMSRFARQFVTSGARLNSGNQLGFSFTVNALNSGYASITVTKS